MFQLIEIKKNNIVPDLIISNGMELEHINEEDIDIKSPPGKAILKSDAALTEVFVEEGGTLYTDKHTPFMLACLHGDLDLIKNLYAKKELLEEDSFGNTPLIYAARNGHNHVIQWLLDQGADLNTTNIHGDSALYISLRFHHLKTAQMLLDRTEIKPFVPNVLGYDAFVISIVNGYLDIAKFLYFDTMDLNKKYCENNTLLHMCAMTGNLETVQWLLDHKANPHSTNSSKLSPFGMAAIKGHAKVMEALIPYIQHHHTFKTEELHRAIIAASSFGYGEVMDLVLKHKRGFTKGIIPFVLMNASIRGHWNIISKSLDLSPERAHKRINRHYNYGDFEYNHGGTLLHAAADNGHLTIVQNLIDKGAHLTHKNHNDDTVLHFAVRSGNVALVRWLCNQNLFVNPVNKQGNTPMHFAVQTNNVEMIRCLLIYGSDFEIENKQKQTAEFLSKSHPDLYRCFQEFKTKDFKHFGLSDVFEELMDGQDKAILQILPLYNDLNACSVDGLSPFQLTANLGNVKPLVILLLWQANCDQNSAKLLAKGLQKQFDPQSKAYATFDNALQQIKVFPQERLDALLSLVSNLSAHIKTEPLSEEKREKQIQAKTSSLGIFASSVTLSPDANSEIMSKGPRVSLM
jgi:ankyrin repeat protein